MFERFLQKECSDENILFWKDCQKFKFAPKEKLQSEAERIFAEYIAHNAPNLVREREREREREDRERQSIYTKMYMYISMKESCGERIDKVNIHAHNVCVDGEQPSVLDMTANQQQC